MPEEQQGTRKPRKRAQSSSFDPPERDISREATSATGRETSCLYAIASQQEQGNSPDVVTGIIKVFNFDVYALIDHNQVYLL